MTTQTAPKPSRKKAKAEPDETPEQPKRSLTQEEVQIAESRESLKHPLAPGQKFFEAADGYIVVGEEDKPHVLDRRQGKRGWINPKR